MGSLCHTPNHRPRGVDDGIAGRETERVLIAFVFVTWFGPGAVLVVALHLVTVRLRRAHPSIYEDLGRPHLFLNNRAMSGRDFRPFLFGRAGSMRDPVLARLARVVKIAYALTLLSMVFYTLTVALVLIGGAPVRR